MKYFASFVDNTSPTGYGSLILEHGLFSLGVPSLFVQTSWAGKQIAETLSLSEAPEIYCLQPVVPQNDNADIFVKNSDGHFRFTTSFLTVDEEGTISRIVDEVFDRHLLNDSARLRLWEDLFPRYAAENATLKLKHKITHATVIGVVPLLRTFFE